MDTYFKIILFLITTSLLSFGSPRSIDTKTNTLQVCSLIKSDLGPLVEENDETINIKVRKFDSTDALGWSASFHVISSKKGNILIDPGKYDKELADYIKSIGGIDAILITHGHWDKLRGLDHAISDNPNAIVYVNELDYPYFQDPIRNCSIEQGFKGITKTKAQTLTEKTYKIANYMIKVIHTPGHTEGSSLFYFPDENILIGGDTIMADLVGSSKHPGGNEEDRQASIKKFKQFIFPDNMRIYSGHGEDSIYSKLMKRNIDLK